MNKSVSLGMLVAVIATVAIPTGARGGQTGAAEAIVYERNGDLFVMAVDGSRTNQLTKTRTLELEPAVSPDGRSIAYVRRGPRGYEPHYPPRRERDLWGGVDVTGGELWTMGVDGKRRTRLTRDARDVGPAWSADGKTILFSRVVQGEYWQPCRAVFRVRRDGGELRRLTGRVVRKQPGYGNLVTAPEDLTVSPDGRRIAFTDWVTCETTDVLPFLNVIDVSGRRTPDLDRQPEVSVDSGNANPTWSPDGGRIAFHRTSRGYGGIYVANRDGSGVRRVTPKTRSGHAPAWSPDGAWIAFVGRGDLYVIRPDGIGLRQLTRTKVHESSPAWLPQMPVG